MLKENKELILKKNNSIVRAKYSLTTNESRIFLMLMYKLQTESKGLLSCTITLSEFKSVIKSSRDNTVDNILNTLSSLRKKPIYFHTINENGSYVYMEYGFINGFMYVEDTREFKIEASERIYIAVKDYMDNGYTPNNLILLFNLRNSNAVRFYDLMRIWSGVKSDIYYSLSELKELLLIEDKYNLYGEFKRKILTPSINELNKTGMIDILFTEKKIGKRVIGITFHVKDKDKRKLSNKNEQESIFDFEYYNKRVLMPNNHIFNNNFALEFVKFCYDKSYALDDVDFYRIFTESILAFKYKKGDILISDICNYKYFLGIFNNKVDKEITYI